MPEIILNAAGFTRTTGTANPTITGDTGKSGSFSDIATGTEVAYYRRYSSNKAGFENGIGIWREVSAAGSIGYIERTSVEKSSNDGAAVVWGVGEQIIDVTITPDMIVADDDPRLDTVAVGDLGTVAEIDGTEAWIAEQGGEGIDLTAAQVLADPVRQARTHGLNYLRGYSNFSKTLPTFSGTNGAICGLEPYISYFSGTGASVVQFAGFLAVNSLGLLTGTTTTGYAAIQHLEYPNTFDPNKHWECIFQGGFNGVLPNVEASTAQIGFTGAAVTALATGGMYFEATEASPNWWAVVRANPANVTKKDTGVAYTNDTDIRFKVVFDPTPDPKETRFYINETLVATTIPSERIVAALTLLQMTAQLRKSAGTTQAGFAVLHHSYAIEFAELVGF